MKFQALVQTEELNDLVAQLDLDIDTSGFVDYKQVIISKDRDIEVGTQLVPDADIVSLEEFVEKVTTITPIDKVVEILDSDELPDEAFERIHRALEIVVGWKFVKELGSQLESSERWSDIVTYVYEIKNEDGEKASVGITISEGKTEMQPTTFHSASLVEPYEVTVMRFRSV